MTLILLLLLLSWLLLSLLLFLLLQLPVPLFLCLSDGAFLTVSIASPEYEDTGFYKCRFAYLNMAEFKFTLLNKTFEVTFTGRLGTLRQRITLSNLVMLHYTTPHYTTLHCTTLHYTALHYTTLHYTTILLHLLLLVLVLLPKGGRGCLMSPSCLESQGCHLIPLSYLLSGFFCLVLLLFPSCHFSANGTFSCFCFVFLFRENSNIFS